MNVLETDMQALKNKSVGATVEKEITWSNKDNNAFYEEIKVEGLKKYAEMAGLADGCDMDVLKPYWTKAKSILEVGAGYGRVIDYLLKQGYQGEITAVERCDVFCSFLREHFSNKVNVDVFMSDVNHYEKNEKKFDLILVLWSGIADFTKQEHLKIFLKLKKILNPNGYLVIDTLPQNVIPVNMTVAHSAAKGTFKKQVGGVTINNYNSSYDEMNLYASLVGFQRYRRIFYNTKTFRQRVLHLLTSDNLTFMR